MLDDGLRARVRNALAPKALHSSLRPLVVVAVAARSRAGRSRRQWTAAVAGGALAVAVIASLIATRIAMRSRPAPAPVSAPPPVPASVGAPGGTAAVASGVGVSCTLPLEIASGPPPSLRTATLSLPDGQVTTYQAPSVRHGGNAYTLGRWVPAPPAAVSPDGRSFAYTAAVPGHPAVTSVRVRDVATDADREVWQGDGWADIAGWTRAGIYVVQEPRGLGQGLTAMLLIDPTRRGAPRRVGPNPPLPANVPTGQLPLYIDSHWVGTGAIWTAYGSKPPPKFSSGGTGHDTVTRMELRTGRLTTWFTAPAGLTVEVVAVDPRGRPILTVGQGATLQSPQVASPQLLLLTGSGQTTELWDGLQPALGSISVLADTQGIWLMGRTELWLSRDGVLQQVAVLPADLAGTVRIAGSCR